MSKSGFSPVVGNDFIVAKPRLRIAVAAPATEPAAALSIIPVMATPHTEFIPVSVVKHSRHSPFHQLLDLAHRFSLAVFALLFLLVGTAGIQVGGRYWSARIDSRAPALSSSHRSPTNPVSGPNIAVPSNQLAAKVQAITSQPLTIVVGAQTATINAGSIKSWLHIVTDQQQHEAYIHVNNAGIQSSLAQIVKDYTKAPVDQVTITHTDGTGGIVVAGKNGSKPGGSGPLADQITKNVLSAKGMQLNLPIQSVPFQAVTPAAFAKLIEVNVVTKQMYLYDNGTLTSSYPISAGASDTPTPLGEFHIYSKLTVQDMSGYNEDGSKYFQPHVHWINYFLPGGYAIHGNYWRPLSYFGNINSSHGCVSLPDDQAEVIYNWAPIGTTVITHA